MLLNPCPMLTSTISYTKQQHNDNRITCGNPGNEILSVAMLEKLIRHLRDIITADTVTAAAPASTTQNAIRYPMTRARCNAGSSDATPCTTSPETTSLVACSATTNGTTVTTVTRDRDYPIDSEDTTTAAVVTPRMVPRAPPPAVADASNGISKKVCGAVLWRFLLKLSRNGVIVPLLGHSGFLDMLIDAIRVKFSYEKLLQADDKVVQNYNV